MQGRVSGVSPNMMLSAIAEQVSIMNAIAAWEGMGPDPHNLFLQLV